MIEVRKVQKRFGQVTALAGVDLEITTPGIVGLLGRNGAGKTTLMRILTGFLSMDEGQARVAGHDVFDAPMEVKAAVGYLPETPPLYESLTIGEQLAFVARLRGVEDAPGRIGAAMEEVGLTGWESRRTGTLSRGYRQRVGLAQAILHEPRLLILDEPGSGLDPVQLDEVHQVIRTLAADRTVLLSSHDLAEIEALCQRVIILEAGAVVADDTIEALRGPGCWHVRVSGAESLVHALSALESVERVVPLGPGEAEVSGGANLGQAIGTLARDNHWVIERLEHQAPDLRSAFKRATGGVER